MRTMLRADPTAVMAFVAVVHHGSFREAARVLKVPRSTLSQRVAHLEEQLGARLLARTTRSVTLTDIGASYHREVSPAMAALQAAEGLVNDLGGRPSGKLRLTAPVEMGQKLFGAVLATYTARYPDVTVEIELSDRNVGLVEEGYDLALRVGPLTDSRLIARRVGTPMHLGVFGSPKYFKQRGTPEHPKDLRKHRCLAMSGASDWTRWKFKLPRRTEFVEVEPFVAVNSFQVLAALVKQGVGVTRLPARFAAPLLKQRSIKEVLKPFALPPRDTFVVYPSTRHVSPAVRAMVELLIESIE